MKIDSGAADTVIPKDVMKHIPICETIRSKKGDGFRAANGSHIRHYGQKSIKGIGDEFQPIQMMAQVADVSTALGSVYKMLQAGNIVHFEPGRCYVQHITTGRVTPIIEKGSSFEIGIWVPKGDGDDPGFARQER